MSKFLDAKKEPRKENEGVVMLGCVCVWWFVGHIERELAVLVHQCANKVNFYITQHGADPINVRSIIPLSLVS